MLSRVSGSAKNIACRDVKSTGVALSGPPVSNRETANIKEVKSIRQSNERAKLIFKEVKVVSLATPSSRPASLFRPKNELTARGGILEASEDLVTCDLFLSINDVVV